MRRDLKMRKGKLVAQGAHASVGALAQLLKFTSSADGSLSLSGQFAASSPLAQWLNSGVAKICLYVDSEAALTSLYQQVRSTCPDVPAELVEDAGITEFHGVPTLTCLALGPYWADELDKFTGTLSLY